MADMSSAGGIESLPPEERVKRLRELETEKRRELDHDVDKRKALEEELATKRKKLEELEKTTKKELTDAETLEERTLNEIATRAREVQELETKIKKFRAGEEFIPATEEQPAAPPPGFGQTGPQYQSQAAQQARQSIDYLLNASQPSTEGRITAERELYRSVRRMAEQHNQGHPDESYTFNKLQEEMQHLKQRDADSNGYIARIENVLNSIVDYRQEDERRRKRG
jgi:hypothetical protein